MRAVSANGLVFHVQENGDPRGPPVLFANSLGTDLRLWEDLLPRLPQGLRLIRFDSRGHGLSACPPGPYALGDLAEDAAALIEALGCGPVTFVGLSIGGMTGQLLAARRPALVRAMVLSNTAARMGDAGSWAARIAAVRAGGLEAIADAVMARWFAEAFRATADVALWRAMLVRTPVEGYLGCCSALASADLGASTARLRLPTLAIAGAEDGASPPAQVAATAALIPGSVCHTIPAAGHLPCVEAPAAMASILAPFLVEHAHD